MATKYAPPSITFPKPSDRYDPLFEGRRNNTITEHLERCLSAERANDFVLLMSPNGSVFKVTVADDGTLSAALY